MEEKKTVFDYLAQVWIVYGFIMLMINIFCLAFGNSAKEFSTMFALGNQGVPTPIAFQFLCVSAFIVGARFLFFTDIFIKKMSLWLRCICMLALSILIIAVFIMAFHWFPANMWQPWVLFFICFGISFWGSCLVMIIKEKVENRQMDEALQRLKEKE